MKKSSALQALKDHLQEVKLFDKSEIETHKSLSPVLKPSKPKVSKLNDMSISHKSSKSIQLLSPHYISPKGRPKVSSINATYDQDMQSDDNKDEEDAGRYSPSVSFSPHLESGSNSSYRKVSLPHISGSGHHTRILSHSTIPNDISGLISPTTMDSLIIDRSTSDYVRQAQSLNVSPVFSRYNKASSTLAMIDAKKSSLSKELFYYPEQLEIYNKLQAMSPEKRKNDDDSEMGIINISEGNRQEVNLLEGRNSYFRLVCYKKLFPVKVRVDLFVGTFEIRVSKTKKKPNAENYDYMFSTNSFEVNYKNPEGIKYLYFAVTAVERLRINLNVSFKASQKAKKDPLPSLMNYEPRDRPKKKNNAYEFFHKDMTPEEVMKLQKIADKIKEEKQKKHLSQSNNLDITDLNQFIAGKYDMIKTEHLVNLVRTREIRQKINKQSRDFQNEEKQKKNLCGTYRDDIRKIKAQWQLEMDEQKRNMMNFQADFAVAMALDFICKEIKNRKTALSIVRLIQERLHMRVRCIQRAVRVFMKRPIQIEDMTLNRKKPIKLTNEEGKLVLNMSHALNSWAMALRPQRMKKVENVIAKCLQDWVLPLKLRAAIEKYKDKVSMVQTKWKKRKENTKERLDMFTFYWNKYCKDLIKEEEQKSKKINSEIIQKISREQVSKHAQKYVSNKMKGFTMAISIFLTLRRNALAATKKTKTEQTVENANNGALLTAVTPTLRTSPSQTFPKLEINPTQEEFNKIFDEIVQELKAEKKL